MNRYDDMDQVEKTMLGLKGAGHGCRLIMQYILGFPSESEEDFLLTLNFIKRVNFDAVRIFKFSTKEATAAYEMKEKVLEEEMSSRKERLTAFLREKKITFDTVGF